MKIEDEVVLPVREAELLRQAQPVTKERLGLSLTSRLKLWAVKGVAWVIRPAVHHILGLKVKTPEGGAPERYLASWRDFINGGSNNRFGETQETSVAQDE